MNALKVVVYRKSLGEDLGPYLEVIEPLMPMARQLHIHETKFTVPPFHDQGPDPATLSPKDLFSGEDYEADNAMVVLYDSSATPIGMCRLGFNSDVPVFLNWFVIDELHRNKGYGSFLLSEVEKYLSSIGKGSCCLAWREMNEVASKFWRSRGFLPATTVGCKVF